MDPLQAAVLCVKLPHLNHQHEGRRKNAAFYNANLKNVTTPVEKDGNWMIYNQYTVRTEHRDAFMAHLTQHNVGNAIYYPLSLHLQQCFDYLGYNEGDFPEAEKASKEVVSLPVYSELNQDQLDYVVSVVSQFSA